MGFTDEETKRRLETERVPYWAAQVSECLGFGVRLVLDPDTLPPDAESLRALDQVALTALRNCLMRVARAPGFRAYARDRLLSIRVRYDANAPAPSYTHDHTARQLTVTVTPREPTWIGFTALEQFLLRQL